MKKNYMRRLFLLAAAFIAIPAVMPAQCSFSTGTGADGAYVASSNTTLAGGTYNFTSFTINSSVTVTVTGAQPLVIYCTGNVSISGTLDLSGGNGTDGITYSSGGTAGSAVAGGQPGGNGTYSSSVGPLNGSNGNGTGAGGQGANWSGGGGAGYATTGQSASTSMTDGVGGPAYGNPQISPVVGGSGGAGGSGGYSCGSGGGDGGGGYVSFTAGGTITIAAGGSILSNGGNGGSDGTGNCGGGGGGSGGSIVLLTNSSLVNNGIISAVGGSGGASAISGPPYYGTGGAGSVGRILTGYQSISGTGTISPSATVNAVLAVTISHTDELCFGDNNATATATPSGGATPYTYAWTPSGGTNATASGLAPGNYTVTVTDNNGCTASATVTITQPPQLVSTATSQAVTCFGSCDGSLIGTVSGGTFPYTYVWNPGAYNGTLVNGVCAGTYTFTGTDANGCITTSTTTVTSPTQVVVSLTPTNATCSCDGSIAANVTGGTPGYTYMWAPGGETTANINGLCAGCYTLTVTDANGCTATQTVCITGNNGPSATVAQLNNVTCNGACDGTATIVPSGGASPYTFAWAPTGGNSSSYNNLCPGTYTVIVTDSNGCNVTVTFTITEPAAMTAFATSFGIDCSGACTGTAMVSASGGNPSYTYLWTPGGMTTPTVTGLCAGQYNVTVTDSTGCTTTATTALTEPSPLTATSSHTDETSAPANDGTATVTASGGTPGYTYTWAPSGGTNATATGLDAGTYTCTITDVAGCTLTVTVTVGTAIGIDPVNAQTLSVNLFPNPAQDHVEISLMLSQKGNVKVELYNLVGEKIDEMNFGNVNAVNHSYDVSHLPGGVYFFRITSGNTATTKKVTVSH